MVGMNVPLALLATLAPAFPQSTPAPAPAPAPAAERILAEALERGQAWELLAELTRIAPHRLAGSPGADRAIEWARGAMLEAGLENVRLEECTVPHWERGEVEELVVLAPPEAEGERLPILALGGSIATEDGGIEAEVVAVESFRELDELGEAARGKLVLFNQPMQRGLVDTFAAYGGAVVQRSQGAVRAARAGALGALVRSMTTRLDDVPHTGALHYEEGVPRVPAAAVSTRGAERLAALLAAGERVRVRLALDCRWLEPARSHNVVGELVGRSLPEEIVVVGAHLDAWDVGQGAHDDGAGCVQALEALRLIRAAGLKPRRTIRAVMFMNEENGLRGGLAYHAAHLEQMDRHVLALESDRGGFSPRGFTSDAGPEAMAVLREVAALLKPIGIADVFPGGGGVDISPMRTSGVPQVGYLPDGQRYFDFHHSERDVLEAVHPRELQLGAAAMAALLYVVADLPETLPRNAPGTR